MKFLIRNLYWACFPVLLLSSVIQVQAADPQGTSAITTGFNGTEINEGTTLWFNANFELKNHDEGEVTTVFWRNSWIRFVADGVPYNLKVPDAIIVLHPDATCAVTSFAGSRWFTTLPVDGYDKALLSGLIFPVPAEGLPKGIDDVSWSGHFSISPYRPELEVKMKWKWSVAAYTNFAEKGDYNDVWAKASHNDTCYIDNSRHPGTPLNYLDFLVEGPRGGGGSNFTGSWSGSETVLPDAADD